MAKRVREVPNIPSRRPTYPWDDWADGSIWELTQGEDFDVTVFSLRNQCYMIAVKRGLKCETHIHGEKLYIQFYEKEEEQ